MQQSSHSLVIQKHHNKSRSHLDSSIIVHTRTSDFHNCSGRDTGQSIPDHLCFPCLHVKSQHDETMFHSLVWNVYWQPLSILIHYHGWTNDENIYDEYSEYCCRVVRSPSRLDYCADRQQWYSTRWQLLSSVFRLCSATRFLGWTEYSDSWSFRTHWRTFIPSTVKAEK